MRKHNTRVSCECHHKETLNLLITSFPGRTKLATMPAGGGGAAPAAGGAGAAPASAAAAAPEKG